MTDPRIDRINAIAGDLADLLKDAMDRVLELADLEVPPGDIVEILQNHQFTPDPDKMTKIVAFGYALMGTVPRPPTDEEAIRAQLDALFAEAPTPIAGTTPAIPDIAIVLRGFAHPISGVLAKCNNGCLKLAASGPSAPGAAPRLIEHFFTYGDVLAVVMSREMTIKTNEPSIIIQH